MRDPMITSCCHTFCSICIHRCLTHDGLCPTCRTQGDRGKLRKNTRVKELVDTFKEARPKLLEHARASVVAESQQEPKAKKRAQEEPAHDVRHQAPRTATLRSRKAIKTSSEAFQDSEPVEVVDEESEDPSAISCQTNTFSFFEPCLHSEVPKDMVSCPICQKLVKEDVINQHLDTAHSDGPPSGPKGNSATLG